MSANGQLTEGNAKVMTYGEPPLAFPYMPDLRPMLVRISIPSIHAPDRKLNPRIVSPFRVSVPDQHGF